MPEKIVAHLGYLKVSEQPPMYQLLDPNGGELIRGRDGQPLTFNRLDLNHLWLQLSEEFGTGRPPGCRCP